MARVVAPLSFNIPNLRFSDLLDDEPQLLDNVNEVYRGARFRDVITLSAPDAPGEVAFGGPNLGLNPASGTVTGVLILNDTTDTEELFISGFSVPAAAIEAAVRSSGQADDFGVWARIFKGSDKAVLSPFEDVASFGRGNDVVRGFGGDDSLWGEAGNDILDGGDGNDDLVGGGGADRIRGGDGNDNLEGGGNDDRLAGQAGDDVLNGQQGNDFLNGNGNNDIIIGGGGRDILVGGGGNDMLSGGGSNDRLVGGGGVDELSGQIGKDELIGGGGRDLLSGGGGRDRLDGGSANDFLTGGAGNDVFIFRKSYAKDEIIDFRLGDDRLALDPRLWGGGLTLEEVAEQFGRQSGSDLLLDFGSDEIRLSGLGGTSVTPELLAGSLVFIDDL